MTGQWTAQIWQDDNILAHRGPDGSNTWSEGSMVWGIECSGRHESLLELLPLVNQTGDLAITADAHIDNRDELIAALNDRSEKKSRIANSS